MFQPTKGKGKEKPKGSQLPTIKSPGEDGHSQANNASRLQHPRPKCRFFGEDVCCEAAELSP